MKAHLVAAGAVALFVVGMLVRPPVETAETVERTEWPTPVVGDPEVLRERYEAWKEEIEARGAEHTYWLALHYTRGLSSDSLAGEYAKAAGSVSIDLAGGALTSEVRGAPPERPLDLWLIDKRSDSAIGIMPEGRDRMVRVGTYAREGDLAVLSEEVVDAPDGFEIDLVAVVPRGRSPEEERVLIGAPTLFQSLYAQEHRAELDAVRRAHRPNLAGIGFAFFSPAAPPPPALDDVFAELVAKGEFLFFNETFEGNGRTCGTCHPSENNLTLDADFIATLPDDDPLFVAEFIPELNFEKNGNKRFENPLLMRKFGLIVENLDGFGDLTKRFTMRGVPHVFAQELSIVPGNEVMPPNERTGWSGDGAPHGTVCDTQPLGRLLDFPIGAVVQHFPLTTDRECGVDFVLPSDEELQAMEAFMKSLGRQVELDLETLVLTDLDADIGRERFRLSACNGCHDNAGANVATGENLNFDTGVEEFLISHPDDTGEKRPPDGGFGTAPDGTFPPHPIPNDGSDPNKPKGSFGNGRFNTASLVEFADTLPAFHNNIIDADTRVFADSEFTGVEAAIEFYKTPEFIQAQGFAIDFGDAGTAQVGKFLRAINAMDNIVSGVGFAERALKAIPPSSTPITAKDPHRLINRFLRFVIADVDDSVDVLSEVGINDEAVALMKEAKCKFLEAMAPQKWEVRADRIARGIDLLKEARLGIGSP